MESAHIRNFCILAHIDHGKSTLADRFLELTGTVEKRRMREQYLDMHPLERERGITIKMQPVRMNYELRIMNYGKTAAPYSLSLIPNSLNSKQKFVLNLIDTPGHVDFSYEVSRALAAVEGAILLVDATQGIQAQTIANLRMAEEAGLVIIPAINKIDLPSADIEKTEEELSELFSIARHRIFKISAKMGTGVEKLLEAAVVQIPAPQGGGADAGVETPLRALVFDSKYDPYLGVVAHVRIMEGRVKKGDAIFCMATGVRADAEGVGVFLPERASRPDGLLAGEIGYIATGIKEPASVRVGDTITNFQLSISNFQKAKVDPLPGYKEPLPMVWASLLPEDQDAFETLRDGLKKLQLEDAALVFIPEESGMLGRGFRAGFLGVLHMEIVAERLRREYALRLVFSRPSVSFRVTLRHASGDEARISVVYAARMLPDPDAIERIEEPWVNVEVITPSRFLGAVTSLVHERGGRVLGANTRGHERLQVLCEAPLREIIVDFYDILKSVTHGFASLSYTPIGERAADLVRLDMMVAGERVDALSEIVPQESVYAVARSRVEKLARLLPRALFAISVQAAVSGRIIARETIPALKKDVTGYLYGGDRTRKMKLWKKQQRGKKRLQESARVRIAPEVFFQMITR